MSFRKETEGTLTYVFTASKMQHVNQAAVKNKLL